MTTLKSYSEIDLSLWIISGLELGDKLCQRGPKNLLPESHNLDLVNALNND